MKFLENKIRKAFAGKFLSRKIFWGKYIKIFCDGGYPKFFWFPFISAIGFHKHWGLKGFTATFLGRKFFFVFGEDKKGLYKGCF